MSSYLGEKSRIVSPKDVKIDKSLYVRYYIKKVVGVVFVVVLLFVISSVVILFASHPTRIDERMFLRLQRPDNKIEVGDVLAVEIGGRENYFIDTFQYLLNKKVASRVEVVELPHGVIVDNDGQLKQLSQSVYWVRCLSGSCITNSLHEISFYDIVGVIPEAQEGFLNNVLEKIENFLP